MGESQNYYAKQKNPQTKDYLLGFNLDEIFRKGTSLEMKTV